MLFILFINSLLSSLQASKLGATIGPIHIATLGFADDIVLASDSPKKLQSLITICEAWANINKMKFNTDKCKVLILNKSCRSRNLNTFLLYGHPLKIVSKYKYLGITIATKNLSNIFTSHFSEILDKASTRLSSIRSFGFQHEGFRLQTSIRLYKLLIRPILEYCAQSLCYTKYYFKSDRLHGSVVQMLENFQTQTLKTLINASRHSPPELIRLLCGVEHLESRFDLLIWKLTKVVEQNLARYILLYRRKHFFCCNKGFAHEVFSLCCKYDAIHIWHGVLNGPNPLRRINPFRRIKQIVSTKNLLVDLTKGRTRTCPFTQAYLANPFCYQKKYQLVDVFRNLDSFHARNAQAKFIRALLHCGRFPKICNFCNNAFSDLLDHQLFRCNALGSFRDKLAAYLVLYNLPEDRQPKSSIDYIAISRKSKLWRKCFTNFLKDVDF